MVFFSINKIQKSRDPSDRWLRDGATKSHQRVHKSRIQIAAAVKALHLLFSGGGQKKEREPESINRHIRPTHCTFNNAYYIHHFPPRALDTCVTPAIHLPYFPYVAAVVDDENPAQMNSMQPRRKMESKEWRK